MKPPPPMFPAPGSTTASAKPTATAASTALPPLLRISTPASSASASSLTTMAFAPQTGAVGHGACCANLWRAYKPLQTIAAARAEKIISVARRIFRFVMIYAWKYSRRARKLQGGMERAERREGLPFGAGNAPQDKKTLLYTETALLRFVDVGELLA